MNDQPIIKSCKHGHLLSEDNLTSKGGCRQCRRLFAKKYRDDGRYKVKNAEYMEKYAQAHREKLNEYKRDWYKARYIPKEKNINNTNIPHREHAPNKLYLGISDKMYQDIKDIASIHSTTMAGAVRLMIDQYINLSANNV